MTHTDICIIGGGAAGLMSAIAAARQGASVIIAERLPRVGKKILSTGNGRCNITNNDLDISHYHGKNPDFARSALSRFDLYKTTDFFDEIGIPFTSAENGKIYPQSLQASSVLDMLRIECHRLGITELTDFFVNDIKLNPFTLISDKGDKIQAKKVIIATGGKAAPAFGSDGNGYKLAVQLGHKLVSPFPSLVQLKTESPIRSLKGIKHMCTATVICEKNRKSVYGEVLFTEYGLSGPPIFDLSRIAAEGIYSKKDVYVSLDLLPYNDRLEEELTARKSRLPHLSKEDFLNGILNKRLGFEVCKMADKPEHIARLIHNFKFKITGTMPWANAQVTAGGINVSDINPKTMESKIVPGVYFAGEIMDIDGDCGGYNLQWAWSSGYFAGENAALSLN